MLGDNSIRRRTATGYQTLELANILTKNDLFDSALLGLAEPGRLFHERLCLLGVPNAFKAAYGNECFTGHRRKSSHTADTTHEFLPVKKNWKHTFYEIRNRDPYAIAAYFLTG